MGTKQRLSRKSLAGFKTAFLILFGVLFGVIGCWIVLNLIAFGTEPWIAMVASLIALLFLAASVASFKIAFTGFRRLPEA
jgi:hypothetical protein